MLAVKVGDIVDFSVQYLRRNSIDDSKLRMNSPGASYCREKGSFDRRHQSGTKRNWLEGDQSCIHKVV